MRHLQAMFLVFVLVLVFAGGVAAEAASFGYVKISGKNLKSLREEQASLEKIIRSWKEGEVILRKETASGLVKTRYTIVTVFAGEKAAIQAFLDKAPYEGDILELLIAKVLFNFDLRAIDEKGEVIMKGKAGRGMVPRFQDPREFVSIVKNPNIMTVYEKLVLWMNRSAADPRAQLQDLPQLRNPRAAIKLYANKLRPEHFLLEWKGLGYTREERLDAPLGWAGIKDVTPEETQDFLDKLDLSPNK